MRKIISVITVLIILLVGCSPAEKDYSAVDSFGENDAYITGVWISYTELDGMLSGNNFKDNFNAALKLLKDKGITDIFVHTRAFCDSIYKSKYFPLRDSVKGYDFDILEYMINECHKVDIKFHAWINPYRVRTADTDVNALPDDSIVKKWLTDEDAQNNVNVCFSGGIYLNPASSEVRQLITDGIREIVSEYQVDGIHFDDYFYPTQESAFDEASYKIYCEGTQKPLGLDDWRRANVNALISGCFTAVKFSDSNIVFSISPSASISENYSRHYADVSSWIKSGCVDYIIPQLYFGFDYPDSNFKFEKLLKDWQNLTKDSNTRLIIGLASYKINTQNEPDKEEWSNGTAVINRQAEICKKSPDVSGLVYFSYSSFKEYL